MELLMCLVSVRIAPGRSAQDLSLETVAARSTNWSFERRTFFLPATRISREIVNMQWERDDACSI